MTFGKCYEEEHEGKAVKQEFNRTLRMFLALKRFSQGQLSKTMWEKSEPGSPAFHFLFLFLPLEPCHFISLPPPSPKPFLLLLSECIPPRAERRLTLARCYSTLLGECRDGAGSERANLNHHSTSAQKQEPGSETTRTTEHQNHWVQVLADWLVWFGITSLKKLVGEELFLACK